jgi:AraC-like DNA-binding protein
MNEACRLLQQSNQNISEIAYQVGFNDSNYFTRQFDRMIGMTPRSFRQKAMKENSR